jgi:hypothetical protein
VDGRRRVLSLLLCFGNPSADGFLFRTFPSFQVAPWTKLPAFYLLDCISKNTFEPYARTFSVFIVPLFLEAYDQVDPPTRRKMEEMLLTWRTGAPGAKELFGVSAQVAIERTIWGGSGNNTVVRGLPQILYSCLHSRCSSRAIKVQRLSPLDKYSVSLSSLSAIDSVLSKATRMTQT